MSIRKYAVVATIIATAGAAWAITSYVSGSLEQDVNQVRLRPTPTAPPEILKRNKGTTKSKFNGPGPHKYKSEDASPINLADVPRVSASSTGTTDYVVGDSRVDSKFSDEQVAAAQAAAASQAMSARCRTSTARRSLLVSSLKVAWNSTLSMQWTVATTFRFQQRTA